MEAPKLAIVVVGLGPFGLRLAAALSLDGHQVFAVDADPDRIEILRCGFSYISEIAHYEVQELLVNGRFAPVCDATSVSQVDAVIVCAEFPVREHSQQTIGRVEARFDSLAPVIAHQGIFGVHEELVGDNKSQMLFHLNRRARQTGRPDVQLMCPLQLQIFDAHPGKLPSRTGGAADLSGIRHSAELCSPQRSDSRSDIGDENEKTAEAFELERFSSQTMWNGVR